MLKWNMELIQVERDFLNFKELHDALKTYQIQTNTLLKTVDSRTVEAANRRLRLTTQKGLEFDEKFKYSFIKYACKHYGYYHGRGERRAAKPTVSYYYKLCTKRIIIY